MTAASLADFQKRALPARLAVTSFSRRLLAMALQGWGASEEIRARMKQSVYLTNHGHQVSLSASFGIATFPDDAGDVTGLLALADRAMFDVKEKGKDAIKLAHR